MTKQNTKCKLISNLQEVSTTYIESGRFLFFSSSSFSTYATVAQYVLEQIKKMTDPYQEEKALVLCFALRQFCIWSNGGSDAFMKKNLRLLNAYYQKDDENRKTIFQKLHKDSILLAAEAIKFEHDNWLEKKIGFSKINTYEWLEIFLQECEKIEEESVELTSPKELIEYDFKSLCCVFN